MEPWGVRGFGNMDTLCCGDPYPYEKLQHDNGTYHVGVEGRGELLSIQIVPVNGGEEHVVLDLIL